MSEQVFTYEAITVTFREGGWPANPADMGNQHCHTALQRKLAGQPFCTNVVECRVDTKHRGYVTTGYYCLDDLPDEAADVLWEPEFEVTP